MNNEFSVVQFFEDGTYEYVRRFVSAEEAMTAVKHYTTSVGVKMGLVKRVIITDGGDCCCFDWYADKGIVFPPKETNGKNDSDSRG
jgi:hypothetical protein